MDPYAFAQLIGDVETWRAGAARDRWLVDLASAPGTRVRFCANVRCRRTHGSFARSGRALSRTRHRARSAAAAFSTAAVNPLAEECFRECHFTIADDLLQEVARDAAPWINLWRDCYAFVASRVAAGLRSLIETAPRDERRVALARRCLRHSANMKMPLTGPGMVVLAHVAFQEVKAAFRAQLRQSRGCRRMGADSGRLQSRAREFRIRALRRVHLPVRGSAD